MKEVAVIGAGPSGLASIRSLIRYKDKINVTAYEVSDKVGGVWINRNPHKNSPMYDGLRANLAKEIICFPEFPFPSDIKESYLPHKRILEYVESYATKFEMHQYIKFRHRVLEVDPFITEGGTERWYVTVRNEETGAMTTKKFDAVMVCTGHESKMYIPEFHGQKTFTGEIMHSRYYQQRDYFSGKTVVIVGSGFSGVDILSDMYPVAKKIYLSHHDERITTPLPDNCEYVPDISKIDGENIVLIDEKAIQADIILLATGYRYDFSFLSEKCRPEVKDDHVTNIYRMMVDINHPSLYYIGLNKLGSPLREFCIQGDLAAAFIAEKIPAVSKEEMQQEYRERYKKYVTDLGLKPKNFHVEPFSQWEYGDTVTAQSLCPQPRRVMAEKLYNHFLKNFFKNFLEFKKASYRVVDDENFEIVYEPEVYLE